MIASLDIDDWIEALEPVAYGLLALKPWEWREMLRRATVTEIRQVIDGALWREERFRDLLGWHSLQSGWHREGTTLKRLLGRDLMSPTVLAPQRAAPPPDIPPLSDEQMSRAVAAIDSAAMRRQKRARGQKPTKD